MAEIMNRFVLHITKSCNFDCRYCYEKNKTYGHVSNLELKNNIDKILYKVNSENLKEKLTIEFLGGEPFLNVDGLEFACKYINEKFDTEVKLTLTTNGSIYNSKIVSILNQYNIKIYLSIDGNKFMHNTCRLTHSNDSTYDLVMENSKKYLSELNIKPAIQLTTHKYNIGFLTEGVKSLYDIGFRHINIGVVREWEDVLFTDEYIRQHDLIIKNLDSMPELNLTPMMLDQEYDMFYSQISLAQKENSSFLDYYTKFDYSSLDISLRRHLSILKTVRLNYKNLLNKNFTQV